MPEPIYYPIAEYDTDETPPATHWFWQVGDQWAAVVGDDERDTWWGFGSTKDDPAALGAPAVWELPIDQRPPYGTLVYCDREGNQHREPIAITPDPMTATVLDHLAEGELLFLDTPDDGREDAVTLCGFVIRDREQPLLRRLNVGRSTPDHRQWLAYDYMDAGNTRLALAMLAEGTLVPLHDDRTGEVIAFICKPYVEEILSLYTQRPLRPFTLIGTISAASLEEARQVAAERLGCDEDYGFEYRIDHYEVLEGPAEAGA
jgi:hypothetical protein